MNTLNTIAAKSCAIMKYLLALGLAIGTAHAAQEVGTIRIGGNAAVTQQAVTNALGYKPQPASPNLTNWSALATSAKQDTLDAGTALQGLSLTLGGVTYTDDGTELLRNGVAVGGSVTPEAVAAALADADVSLGSMSIDGFGAGTMIQFQTVGEDVVAVPVTGVSWTNDVVVAGGTTNRMVYSGGVLVGVTTNYWPPAGYLLNQNFEAPGYDNGETWTETENGGSINAAYATESMTGARCLLISDTAAPVCDITSPAFTAQQSLYGYLQFQMNGVPGAGEENPICTIQSGSNARCTITVKNDGKVYIDGNVSGSVSTVGVLDAYVKYHIWWSVDTTASPETVTVGVSDTGTRPTSGNYYASGTVEITDASTLDSLSIRPAGLSANTLIDRILVSTAQIGNNP